MGPFDYCKTHDLLEYCSEWHDRSTTLTYLHTLKAYTYSTDIDKPGLSFNSKASICYRTYFLHCWFKLSAYSEHTKTAINR